MTNAAGWTNKDRDRFWLAYNSTEGTDSQAMLVNALSAINAVRAAPDEPSADIKEVLRRHLGDVLTMQERLDLYKDLRESRLTLAAPGMGEKYDPLDNVDEVPKPTAPEPEYEEIQMVRVTWKGGGTAICEVKDMHATDYAGTEYGVLRFPKPATCPTCGQTKKAQP